MDGTRIAKLAFWKKEPAEDLLDEYEEYEAPETKTTYREAYQAAQQMIVNRSIRDFDEAKAAATSYRTGAIHILNLSHCQPELREKVKDFLNGVAYQSDGTFTHAGEASHIWMLCPAAIQVRDEVQSSPRKTFVHN